MLRRDFVIRLPLAAGWLSTAGLSGCVSTPYLSPITAAGDLRVPLGAIPVGGAFVRTGGAQPLFVSLDAAGDPHAVSSRCTHRGCQVEPAGERLVCPCHGSAFDRSGRVLEGPAEDPLERVPARIEGDDLVLDVAERGRDIGSGR
ncbi:MAG: Rieske (2Fe-2S) protein [Longimicrobiales bacterium]|nr:Rieske (2Fe-2S) protein [Longimicrobiales bacterium]